MQLPIVENELLERLHEQQADLRAGALDLLRRAERSADETLTVAAAAHYRDLAAHLALVDALLDALVIDDPHRPPPTNLTRPRPRSY